MAVITPEAQRAIDERTHARRWWILAVLCLSLLIVFIGNSSLNVTLPTLSRELQATESQLQWVVAIYSLVFAGLLFTTGAIGDRFGRKGALQAGLFIFLIGALLASQASSMWELIACRAVMGTGAAFIMPSTLSILINTFPPHERAKAIAIWASITGAAGGFGPLVSGALLAHFWWGSIFLINVPLLILALISGYFLVPKSRDPEEDPLDPIGAVLSTVGIVALVYGLIEAPDKGWGSPTAIISFVVAIVVLVAFALWEKRVKEPMLDLDYFKNRAFSTGTSGMILVFLAMYGVMFLITQYFQEILGYSPLSAAARLLPMAAIMLCVSPWTPKVTKLLGTNRAVAMGMTLSAIGLLMFRGLTTSTPYWYTAACFVPFTAGLALTMSPMTAAIMSAVPSRRAGAGSAMNDATRELGAALGVAVLGSIAASKYSSSIASAIGGLSPAAKSAAQGSLAGAQAEAAKLPAAAGQALTTAANQAFVDGIHLAVTIGAVLAILSAAMVLRYLPRGSSSEGAMHGSVESLEATAELGLAGGYPLVAEELDDREAERDAELEAEASRSSG